MISLASEELFGMHANRTGGRPYGKPDLLSCLPFGRFSDTCGSRKSASTRIVGLAVRLVRVVVVQSISVLIVEHHHGSLWADTRSGVGEHAQARSIWHTEHSARSLTSPTSHREARRALFAAALLAPISTSCATALALATLLRPLPLPPLLLLPVTVLPPLPRGAMAAPA